MDQLDLKISMPQDFSSTQLSYEVQLFPNGTESEQNLVLRVFSFCSIQFHFRLQNTWLSQAFLSSNDRILSLLWVCNYLFQEFKAHTVLELVFLYAQAKCSPALYQASLLVVLEVELLLLFRLACLSTTTYYILLRISRGLILQCQRFRDCILDQATN